MNRGKALYEALQDDPSVPFDVRPLGWLYSMIEECSKPEAVEALAGDDPDAWWTMVNEVRDLARRLDSARQIPE